ncbi:MAG: Fic family protein [Desulfovibrionaceae bacterium]
MEPVMPPVSGELENLALDLYKASARLSGRVHPVTAKRIVRLLRNVNSYYSNLIEGISTTLVDIEAGLRDLSEDEKTRKFQMLHRKNIEAQAALDRECPDPEGVITSPDFLCRLHRLLFDGLPEDLLIQRDAQGERHVRMRPGELRNDDVRVGRHFPPTHTDIPSLLDRFHAAYSLNAHRGVLRLVAAAASHHRLLWIHPFLEGNGRVARLFTDTYFACSGLEGYGLWTLSRGLARREAEYKELLAGADAPRQGDFDGRGALSAKALGRFCRFFLETALDQARFMDSLLHLDTAEKNLAAYCTLREQGVLAGKKRLPPRAGDVLAYTFVHGELPKGRVHELLGVSIRTARDVANQLVAEGLLESEGHKAPYTIGFPAESVPYIFPELCDPGALTPTLRNNGDL